MFKKCDMVLLKVYIDNLMVKSFWVVLEGKYKLWRELNI